MARSNQTFKKRQRENKLREKAQLKRERRQQRQSEKKRTQVLAAEPASIQPGFEEGEFQAGNQIDPEQSS